MAKFRPEASRPWQTAASSRMNSSDPLLQSGESVAHQMLCRQTGAIRNQLETQTYPIVYRIRPDLQATRLLVKFRNISLV